MVLGAAVVAAALLWCPDGPVRGGVTLAALAALTALTALSITWSIAPDLSYEDAGRMLAYLAVFAAAIAGARMAPRSAPVLLHALLLAAVAVVVYVLHRASGPAPWRRTSSPTGSASRTATGTRSAPPRR